MNTVLRRFVDEPIFDACAALLGQLHIAFNEITRTPVSFDSLYPGQVTKVLQEIMRKVEHTYFIGTVDEASLSGEAKLQKGDEVTQEAANGRYAGMMIFAAEIRDGQKLTRTEMATLTRGFNRIAAAQPVVLFIKQNDKLALATCERSDYSQQWRDGEKLGKVSLLRDINCQHPHRGHIDILESLGDKAYPTFEELYKHWMQVFSNELLTKKFYSELQNWYFWAIKMVRFPNDIEDDTDDQKYNNENVIRLITRLMFVWFLKQKGFVNEDLFDVNKLKKILKSFDELSDQTNYYVGIIQNLFFATLNQEIPNRQFVKSGPIQDKGKHSIKTYFRNQKLFIDEKDEAKIINLFNRSPYVNGSLFECLDDKVRDGKTYCWDGFSQHKHTKEGMLKQAVVPNYLFFTKENAKEVDLRTEYGKESEYLVKVSGLITILNKYHFTIEENTPLDEDVALDPELLGRVFENLLGAFNPETKVTARKNSGSYYTPRNIVNYMVKESIFAFLKAKCPDVTETILLSLLNYHELQKPDGITDDQIKHIVHAIYHCKILDPACGSGAFPMGVVQLFVHVLRKLDDSNKYWNKVVLEEALKEVDLLGDKSEEEKEFLAKEIKESFDLKVQYPDYARKLYIIEKCIYGVDIQTVAVQISRLRCFISLLCEQRTNNDPAKNYGIKPLPNLETNFVAANTLIPLNLSDEDRSLLNDETVIPLIEELREVRHKLFLPRNKSAKQRYKDKDEKLRDAIERKVQEVYNSRLAQKMTLIDSAIANEEKLLANMTVEDEVERVEQVKEYDIFGGETMKKIKKPSNKSIVLARIKSLQDDKQHIEQDNRLSQIINNTRKLTRWNPFDQNYSCPFFDSEWMFGVSDGFDVVIGNPPWGADLTKKEKELFKMIYKEIDSSTPNSFAYFIGWSVRNYKYVVSYVLPDSLLIKDYSKTRELIVPYMSKVIWYQNAGVPYEVKPFKYVDHDVCVVDVYSSISDWAYFETNYYNNRQIVSRGRTLEKRRIIRKEFEYSINLIVTEKDLQILEKLSRFMPISCFMQCHEGIHTGNVRDKLFIKSNRDGLKPLFYGGGAGDIINSYYSTKSGWFVNYRKDIIDKSKGEYASLRDESIFLNPKIYITRTGNPFKAFYDEDSYASNNFFSLQMIDLSDNTTDNLLFVLAFINSKTCQYFIRVFAAPRLGSTFVETKIFHLLKYPIPDPDDDQKKMVVEKVKEIISVKKRNPQVDTSEMESQIDFLVYKLYELSFDEVLIIDPMPPFTREEYEKNL